MEITDNVRKVAFAITATCITGLAITNIVLIDKVEILKAQLRTKERSSRIYKNQFEHAIMKMTPDQLRQQIDDLDREFKFEEQIHNFDRE